MRQNSLWGVIGVTVLGQAALLPFPLASSPSQANNLLPTLDLSHPIVSTGQTECFDDEGRVIPPPKPDEPFFCQDAQIPQRKPAYCDNNDGTVTDLNNGLMWTRDLRSKKTYQESVADARRCWVGGHDDWRLSIAKELYSLILFSGIELKPQSKSPEGARPFIDTNFFVFRYGQLEKGEQIIDAQFATAALFIGRTLVSEPLMFSVNFADGRIKACPTRGKTYYVLYVRGNLNYGKNDFHDNGDRTITDFATGLMWMKYESGRLKAGLSKDGRMSWRWVSKR